MKKFKAHFRNRLRGELNDTWRTVKENIPGYRLFDELVDAQIDRHGCSKENAIGYMVTDAMNYANSFDTVDRYVVLAQAYFYGLNSENAELKNALKSALIEFKSWKNGKVFVEEIKKLEDVLKFHGGK